MNRHPLTKKGSDHRSSQTEISFERKAIRIDRLQPFKGDFNSLTFKSFDKFFEQYSCLLSKGIKNNENPFSFQMKSSDINMSNNTVISLHPLLLTKKRAPDKSGALVIFKQSQ